MDENDIYVSVDTDNLISMIKESVNVGSYIDLNKLRQKVDPDGVHIFFNAENTKKKNELKTMWWVKTLGDSEPVIMVFSVPQKTFSKYSKIISASPTEDGVEINWYG